MQIPRLQTIGTRFRKYFLVASLAAATALPTAAQAGPFSDMYVFGDSLSDTGNLHAMTSPPSPISAFFPVPFPPSRPIGPYADGRFSNGTLWIEGLAGRLGLRNKAKASGFSLGPVFGEVFIPADDGNNFAVAAARTATTGFFEQVGLPVPTGIQTQVEAFGGQEPDPGVLYVVMAGGNNIRDAALLPKHLRTLAATRAAQEYGVAIGDLIDKGARTILVSNVNDIGKTPEAALILRNAAAATQATTVFNATLARELDALEVAKGVRFIRLDLFGVFDAVYSDAARGGHVFGLSNATMPCFNAADLEWIFPNWPDPTWSGANCRTSLFSDALHPTAALHAILARTAAACRLPDGKFLGGMPPEGGPTQALGRFCHSRQPSP